MSKNNNLIFIIFLVFCIFICMSFASANNITEIDDSNNMESIDVNHTSKSFSDLDNLINNDLNKSEIILEDDYVNPMVFDYEKYEKDLDYEPDWQLTEGILINRSLVIDGNGHVIDANKSLSFSRIFYITANNVTLKNITFKNGYGWGYGGGAIYCIAPNMTVENCVFLNNEGFGAGGAIYFNASNIHIINSTFIGNFANLDGGAISCCGLNTNIVNSTFINNSILNMLGPAAISLDNGFIVNSTFINNYQIKMDTAFYYYDCSFNVVNESISYSDNCDKVRDVVFFYKKDVIIINSTFKNTPTYEIHYNQPLFGPIAYDDADNNTNTTNPSNNSSDVNNTNTTKPSNNSDVNNTNKTYENPAVVSDEDVDKNMSQITPILTINADDKYIIGNGDVINIAFKTNIMNKNFWVEIPGLLSKCNLTSDNNFSATLTLKDIVKSGNYTVLCGFYDYNAPVVVGSDDIPGVACKKIIEIICLDDENKSDSIVNTTDTNKTDSIVNTTGNKTDVIKPIASVDTSKKSSSIVVAKNKVFNKKLKTKLCPVVLKSKNGKVLKNTWITLKIKGKLFKAKTNGKGRATFKITKFFKKGNFKAVIKFKGSKKYNPVSKKITIKIK